MAQWKSVTVIGVLLIGGCGGGADGPAAHSALLSAAAEGRTAAAARDLDQNPDGIDRPDSAGRTALHMAALNGHPETVKLLLDDHANPNVRDHAGQTPLHYAAIGGNIWVVKLLLQARADPAATDDTGKTALELARMTGHGDAAEILEKTH